MITCFECKGEGDLLAIHARMSDGSSQWGIPITCGACDGSGKLPDECAEWRERASPLRQRRLNLHVGLREFAEAAGLLPSYVSKAQRGLAHPGFLERALANLGDSDA